MNVRPVTDDDIDAWLTFRCALRPTIELDVHRADIEYVFANKFQYAALVSVDSDDQPLGFTEVSLPTRVDGCETSPVGSLDALFVKLWCTAGRRGDRTTPDCTGLGCWSRLPQLRGRRGARQFRRSALVDHGGNGVARKRSLAGQQLVHHHT